MKRTYETPVLEVEIFQLDAELASTCNYDNVEGEDLEELEGILGDNGAADDLYYQGFGGTFAS